MPLSDVPYTIDLYVRSLAASEARTTEVVSHLDDLEDAGTIDAYEIHVWGKGVCLDPPIAETEAGTLIRERIAAFREWADETGRELPGFADRTRHSAITDHTHAYVAVPSMALCERRDGDVEWVTPYTDDDTTTTVADRLVTLAGDDARSTSAHGERH